MIGDFVGSFYQGYDHTIRDWIRQSYLLTLRTAHFAKLGAPLSDVFGYAEDQIASIGGRNNTLSITMGTSPGADVGHTIPGFGARAKPWIDTNKSTSELATVIASGRTFLNQTNNTTIANGTAFTIEPQIVVPGLPMSSFHVIVAFEDGKKFIIEEYDRVFECFGMNWIKD